MSSVKLDNWRDAKARPSAEISLEGYLERERHRLFVGRDAELQQFRRLLKQRTPPSILVISGAAGTGKSMLLSELLYQASMQDFYPCRIIDARHLSSTSPATLEATLTDNLQGREDDKYCILAIDNVEQITALETWMGERLPSLLPEHSLLILAGRWHPPPYWRTDPGLSSILIEWHLKELDERSVRTYLDRRELNPQQQQSILDFARGYPLAMALAADHLLRTGQHTLDPSPPRDIIQPLVEWLIIETEQQGHLPVLEAAATVPAIDLPLLQALLETDSGGNAYRWLTSQPYIEYRQDGLVMHELVRSVLIQDLRQRDLGRHHQLIRRAAGHYLEGLKPDAEPRQVHHKLSAIFYLLRWEPYVYRHYAFDPPQHHLDTPKDNEIPALANMVEKLEGTDSRHWFEYWQHQSPAGLLVVRGRNGQPTGLAKTLLFDAEELQTACDPVVIQLREHIQAHKTLTDGGKVLLMRFAMIDPTYQARGHAWTHIETLFNSLVFTPEARLICLVCDRDRDWWGSREYANMDWLPATEFETGHRRLGLMGIDLRNEPAMIWVRNCIERILAGEGRAMEQTPHTAVINRPDFEQAVLEALGHLHSDDELAVSGLSRSKLIQELRAQRHYGSAEAIRALLTEAAESLSEESPARHLPEILGYAYFRSDRKQLTAAERLGVSERTFRRRLREAEQRLIERLWTRETQLTLQYPL